MRLLMIVHGRVERPRDAGVERPRDRRVERPSETSARHSFALLVYHVLEEQLGISLHHRAHPDFFSLTHLAC